MITYEELHKQVFYDPFTGIFIWKISKLNGCTKGEQAGYRQGNYISITIDGIPYMAHRLAWLYYYGYMPEKDIDHRDRIGYHNWILNLRQVSQQCNQRNTGNRCHNTSGVKGVSKQKGAIKWKVEICVNKKNKYLGTYKDFNNAVCARLAAEQCLNWEGCDSCSPAYLYVKENIL